MSWCLGLPSWKVDGVCEWKWQAMVIHKTAFSFFAVLCERYNLITKISLSIFTRTDRTEVVFHPVLHCATISSCLQCPGCFMWVLGPVQQQLPKPLGWQALVLVALPSCTLQRNFVLFMFACCIWALWWWQGKADPGVSVLAPELCLGL